MDAVINIINAWKICCAMTLSLLPGPRATTEAGPWAKLYMFDALESMLNSQKYVLRYRPMHASLARGAALSEAQRSFSYICMV
jgi:hypothetical protein